MKFVSFDRSGIPSYGVLVDDGVADLGAKFGNTWPTLGIALRAGGFDELVAAVDDAPVLPRPTRYLAPITDPKKIICIGLNYRSHIEETGRDIPEYPMLFARYPDSLVAHGEALLRPAVSEQLDFEGELACVIGTYAHRVSKQNALDYVMGYSCINEGSVRDFQRHTLQFTAGKTFWRTGSFGPHIVTADEIPDPSQLELTTRLNGQVMQHAMTSDLMFDIPELIEYITTVMPLEPGDVISTGTTGGIGARRDPPVWMKPGDTVEVELSQIGVLENPIEDAPP